MLQPAVAGEGAVLARALRDVLAIAQAAGRLALEHYGAAQTQTTLKNDRSPLTAADMASHGHIVARLQGLWPWPTLSEESAEVPHEARAGWRRFWLVDPLDGTREFLNRNGEFTVNIALIDAGRPVLGVVHAPALALTYLAVQGMGAFRLRGDGPAERIFCRKQSGRLMVVVSRSHLDDRTTAWLQKLKEYEAVSVGSSLKFCLVAEGRAQLYPRLAPTMEWDTAAAQCVLEEAGGSVRDLGERPLRYNKRDLRNPFFIARGSADQITAG
jgi:3'(2'), 5'-bisphosphate nucleotidase